MQQNVFPEAPFVYPVDEASTSALFQQSMSTDSESTAYMSAAGPIRRNQNGMRKNSPEALIPMDAPTQARRYLTPSATSRKEVPAFFYKMRTASPPSDDEEDELVEEAPAPNATDQEKIEWKRRQNTLAARRSRKRKVQNLQRLEQTVEQLTREREIWKTRAMALKQILNSHNIVCPDFRD
jgi:hypothetical protein